jgi:hypothetical protein
MYQVSVVFEHIPDLFAYNSLFLFFHHRVTASVLFRWLCVCYGVTPESIERGVENLQALIARETMREGYGTFGGEVVPSDEEDCEVRVRQETLAQGGRTQVC